MTALDVFISERITSLPVNPAEIARRNGIRLTTYRGFSEFSRVDPLRISEDGFTIFEKGRYYILYNHEITSIARQRWTLMHELCHIWLGHAHPSTGSGHSLQNDRIANSLAADTLAPLPVLHLCDVETTAQLAGLCGISMEAAGHQMRRLTQYRRLDMPMDPNEARIVELFLSFINSTVSARILRRQNSARYGGVDVFCAERELS